MRCRQCSEENLCPISTRECPWLGCACTLAGHVMEDHEGEFLDTDEKGQLVVSFPVVLKSLSEATLAFVIKTFKYKFVWIAKTIVSRDGKSAVTAHSVVSLSLKKNFMIVIEPLTEEGVVVGGNVAKGQNMLRMRLAWPQDEHLFHKNNERRKQINNERFLLLRFTFRMESAITAAAESKKVSNRHFSLTHASIEKDHLLLLRGDFDDDDGGGKKKIDQTDEENRKLDIQATLREAVIRKRENSKKSLTATTATEISKGEVVEKSEQEQRKNELIDEREENENNSKAISKGKKHGDTASESTRRNEEGRRNSNAGKEENNNNTAVLSEEDVEGEAEIMSHGSELVFPSTMFGASLLSSNGQDLATSKKISVEIAVTAGTDNNNNSSGGSSSRSSTQPPSVEAQVETPLTATFHSNIRKSVSDGVVTQPPSPRSHRLIDYREASDNMEQVSDGITTIQEFYQHKLEETSVVEPQEDSETKDRKDSISQLKKLTPAKSFDEEQIVSHPVHHHVGEQRENEKKSSADNNEPATSEGETLPSLPLPPRWEPSGATAALLARTSAGGAELWEDGGSLSPASPTPVVMRSLSRLDSMGSCYSLTATPASSNAMTMITGDDWGRIPLARDSKEKKETFDSEDATINSRAVIMDEATPGDGKNDGSLLPVVREEDNLDSNENETVNSTAAANESRNGATIGDEEVSKLEEDDDEEEESSISGFSQIRWINDNNEEVDAKDLLPPDTKWTHGSSSSDDDSSSESGDANDGAHHSSPSPFGPFNWKPDEIQATLSLLQSNTVPGPTRMEGERALALSHTVPSRSQAIYTAPYMAILKQLHVAAESASMTTPKKSSNHHHHPPPLLPPLVPHPPLEGQRSTTTTTTIIGRSNTIPMRQKSRVGSSNNNKMMTVSPLSSPYAATSAPSPTHASPRRRILTDVEIVGETDLFQPHPPLNNNNSSPSKSESLTPCPLPLPISPRVQQFRNQMPSMQPSIEQQLHLAADALIAEQLNRDNSKSESVTSARRNNNNHHIRGSHSDDDDNLASSRQAPPSSSYRMNVRAAAASVIRSKTKKDTPRPLHPSHHTHFIRPSDSSSSSAHNRRICLCCLSSSSPSSHHPHPAAACPSPSSSSLSSSPLPLPAKSLVSYYDEFIAAADRCQAPGHNEDEFLVGSDYHTATATAATPSPPTTSSPSPLPSPRRLPLALLRPSSSTSSSPPPPPPPSRLEIAISDESDPILSKTFISPSPSHRRKPAVRHENIAPRHVLLADELLVR